MKNKTTILDRHARLVDDIEKLKLSDLLFVVLFYAKITDQINWNWFFVFLPLIYRGILFLFFFMREGYLRGRLVKAELKAKEELKKEAIKFAEGVKGEE